MKARLTRIHVLTATLAVLACTFARALGVTRPLGVALGAGAAWLDFLLLQRLASAALARRPPLARLVPLALAKSIVLLVVPATALLLPSDLVDGVSFAIGVSALPVAIVVDASLPLPARAV